MIVCIAEKPSVAKEIAKELGATKKKDGYFEGNGYQVTWAFGHLFHIKEPQEMNKVWEKWSLNYLPMLPEKYDIELNADKGSKAQYKVIKELYKKADRIVNCGDAGQEGELIQRRIMQYAGVRCPVDRLWISSLTEESIKDGFKHLQPQSKFDSLNEAGEARADGDWLLGMNCTRLYSCKYGDHTVLSIGRVQTPTLAIVVNRDNEIANFKPQPYWTLQTTYRKVVFSWCGELKNGKLAATANRFDSEDEAKRHLTTAKERELTVSSIEKKKGQELPPQLYDLTSLQVDCNRKFGFSADKTLKTMQSLYEKKMATYPRVDTKYLTHDIYSQCPKILRGLKGFESFTKRLEGKALPMSKKVFDDSKVTDHHAIIPTGETSGSLSTDEQRMYDLICKRFIAVFYPPCTYNQTTMTANSGTECFKATGRTIIDLGWKAIYGNGMEEESEDNSEKEQNLPDFKDKEHGAHKPELVRKMTTPPKHYTEASLLQAMETAGRFVDSEELREALKENGIGRPSSRASIIETLLKRNYIARDKKNVVSTETGRKLISIIKDRMLVSPETTGQWEKKLRMIEKGKFSRKEFMSELQKQLEGIVRTVKSDTAHIILGGSTQKKSGAAPAKKKADKKAMTEKRYKMTGAQLEGKTCPKCGIGIIHKGPYSYYCTEYKNGCSFRKPLK